MSIKNKKIFRAAGAVMCAALLMFALSGRRADAQSAEGFYPASDGFVDSVHHTYLNPGYVALIDSASNVITDSTGELEPFLEKLALLRGGGDGTVSVLHIGDSHVQAGFLTGRIRELFQSDFGNAGRGYIMPHRMAKMNEARDYSISTQYGYKSAKSTERDVKGKLGFSGVSVTFETPYNELKVWSKTPFNGLTVFHAPGAPMLCEPDQLSVGSYCTIDNTPTSTHIVLSQQVDSLTLSGFVSDGYDDPTFYGFSLENGRQGVLYHSVGVNGAAFEHYVQNTTVVTGGAQMLAPDLIIISLGTNNCYGNNFQHARMYNTVDSFVRSIKEGYPGVPVLITTPMESCQRKTLRGRRAYVPNPNIVMGVEIICDVAADNEVACWNLYQAAGGSAAMERWFPRGLANTDRIHLTEEGYLLQGDMFYDAFARYFNEYITRR